VIQASGWKIGSSALATGAKAVKAITPESDRPAKSLNRLVNVVIERTVGTQTHANSSREVSAGPVRSAL
jgi:hypothetical protein